MTSLFLALLQLFLDQYSRPSDPSLWQ